jgi:membrane protease YdiL (CAAX protease family)
MPPKQKVDKNELPVKENNKKQTKGVIGLLALLILPNGIFAAVGVAVTMLFYPEMSGEPVAFFMERPWPGFIFAALAEAAAAFIIYYTHGKKTLRPILGQPNKVNPVKHLFLGLAIGGGAVSLAVLALGICGIYRPLGFGSVKGLLVGAALGLGAGVAEEILFRGVVLPLFHKKYRASLAVLFTALIFGAVHFANNSSIAEVIGVFVAAGLLLNGVWFLTKNIWICIGAHFAWNFFEGGIFGMNVSGVQMNGGGLLRAEMLGSDLLTGGVNGPEASVPFVAAISIIGAIVLFVGLRRGNAA